jgi:hypothetical protein
VRREERNIPPAGSFLYGEHLEAEEFLQVLALESRCGPEQAVAVKTPVRAEDMQVAVKALRVVSKSSCGHIRSGHGPRLWRRGLQEGFQGFPAASADLHQQRAIISLSVPDPDPEEIAAFVQAAPPMRGAELITAELLGELWSDMGKALADEADSINGHKILGPVQV